MGIWEHPAFRERRPVAAWRQLCKILREGPALPASRTGGPVRGALSLRQRIALALGAAGAYSAACPRCRTAHAFLGSPELLARKPGAVVVGLRCTACGHLVRHSIVLATGLGGGAAAGWI